jgi:hypothetical protein
MSNTMWRAAYGVPYHSRSRAAYRTPQLPELCKRRICVPPLDMLSGDQSP